VICSGTTIPSCEGRGGTLSVGKISPSKIGRRGTLMGVLETSASGEAVLNLSMRSLTDEFSKCMPSLPLKAEVA
jgi:hypothetical protein